MTLKVKTGKSGCGRAAGILSVAIGAAVATGALAYAPAPVVFDTPAADEKGAMILGNRWPAFWGPNFNWCPDEDEGGIYQNVIQSMLMQYEGDKIFLLPAWPKDWNCDFKLHAPRNTTVEGRVENGELKDLVVTPASRRADVVISH